MPKPRKCQVSLDVTPYYHCVSRCVRRAFLCGFDKLQNRSFEHRREWIDDRIHFLASIFGIDVCAYAVMSNHYHIVLHINKPKALAWSNMEVCERWHKLFRGTPLTQKYLRSERLSEAEMIAVELKLDQWRLQLTDISWFMRLINEPIARQANHEDNCTGKFWEARFKSQALCDEKALAACLTYVDLNPIRARIADKPESSAHTSIKERIEAVKQGLDQPRALARFVGNPRNDMPQGLPFHLKDYLELVDWTGRIIREDKKGAIPSEIPPILERLEIDPKYWMVMAEHFGSRFGSLVGGVDQLIRAARKLRYIRTPGLSNCRAIFN
jgi:REP element-mobilizing transposase RayT